MMNALRDVKQPPPLLKSTSSSKISPSKPGSILSRKKKSFVESAASAAIQLITEPDDDQQDQHHQISLLAPAAGPQKQSLNTTPIPSVLLPSTSLKTSQSSIFMKSTVSPAPLMASSAASKSEIDMNAKKNGWFLIREWISTIPIIGPVLVPAKRELVIKDFNVAVWSAQSKSQ